MGIHSVGIDVSEFNCMIASCKAARYDYAYLQKAIKKMLASLETFEHDNRIQEFENELLAELAKFNNVNFPGYDFKYKINQGNFNENKFAKEKEKEFLPIYQKLLKKYSIKQEKDVKTRKILALILSRTIRSCRATTHSDLATLKEPQLTTYYCYKHKKIAFFSCKIQNSSIS